MEPIGKELRRERELREMSLAELAQTTRIPVRMLERLEADAFDELPGDVFVRGFLRAYARALGIDEDAIVERYGKGRASDAEPPAPLPSVAPPERGRRFGIAIALVILLILFTLALSIVLRPRHRDAPIELSLSNTARCVDTAHRPARAPTGHPDLESGDVGLSAGVGSVGTTFDTARRPARAPTGRPDLETRPGLETDNVRSSGGCDGGGAGLVG